MKFDFISHSSSSTLNRMRVHVSKTPYVYEA